MQLHEVKELVEASSPEHAEELIKSGWTLVAIVPGNRYENGQHSTGPIYVLGQSAPEPGQARVFRRKPQGD
jgi:hypothetical protein